MHQVCHKKNMRSTTPLKKRHKKGYLLLQNKNTKHKTCTTPGNWKNEYNELKLK